MLFDILFCDGRLLTDVPYEERRERLESLELNGAAWQTPSWHAGDGRPLLEAARAKGLRRPDGQTARQPLPAREEVGRLGQGGGMKLPLEPPIKPQLAKTRKALPLGDEWAYEEKLDGFRAIVFVDGDESYIQSRSGKPLSRYFPEMSFSPGRYVIDGELVIRGSDGEVQFDTLQMRIHPAESRIKLLSEELPAEMVVFDLLAEDDESLLELPLSERRARLERLAGGGGADRERAGAGPRRRREVAAVGGGGHRQGPGRRL